MILKMLKLLKLLVILINYETIFKENFDFENDWKLLSRNEVFNGNTIKRYKSLFDELIK